MSIELQAEGDRRSRGEGETGFGPDERDNHHRGAALGRDLHGGHGEVLREEAEQR